MDQRNAGEHIFYDGDCGVCHWAVRWVARHDREEVFRFAPLGGPTFRQVFGQASANLPDSMAVANRKGEVLWRSAGMVYILRRLGGGWRLAGTLVGWIPRFVRDFGYDLFARIRHRLAAKPEGACPLMPPELGRRFDP